MRSEQARIGTLEEDVWHLFDAKSRDVARLSAGWICARQQLPCLKDDMIDGG